MNDKADTGGKELGAHIFTECLFFLKVDVHYVFNIDTG